MSEKPLRRPTTVPVIPSPATAAVALLARRRGFGVLLSAAILALAFALASPPFATEVNVIGMLADASVLGIAALGLFLVVVSGGVDLSIGAIAGLAPLLGGLWIGHPAAPVLLLLALAVGGGIGLLSGLLVVGGGLAAFAVTLGVEAVVHSVASMLELRPERAGLATTLLPDLDARVVGLPVSVALLAVVAGLVSAFLYGLRGGRVVMAIGSNRRAARDAGLDVFTFGLLPYVASGVLAALAGLLSVTAAPSSLAITELNGTLTLDALAAVVIGGVRLRGGRGTVAGVLAGVAMVVILRSGLSLLDVSPLLQGLVLGLLLLVGLGIDRIADRGRG